MQDLSSQTRDQTHAPCGSVLFVFSTVVFATENNLHISAPTQFKTVLFKGQLCLFPGLQGNTPDYGINKKSAQEAIRGHRCWKAVQVYNPEMKGSATLSALGPRASPPDVTHALSKCGVGAAGRNIPATICFFFFFFLFH